MAKLRHCAKFRCTGVLRRIADEVFGRGREEKGGISSVKKGVRKASDQTILDWARGTGSGRRKRTRLPRWWLKQEGQCAARPEAEARAGATGSDLVILSLAILPPCVLLLPVTVPPRYRNPSRHHPPRYPPPPLLFVHPAIKPEL
jgi:hypothetical protein